MVVDNGILKIITKECCRSLSFDDERQQFTFPFRSALPDHWIVIRKRVHHIDPCFHLDSFNNELHRLACLSELSIELPINEICDKDLMQGEMLRISLAQGYAPVIILIKMKNKGVIVNLTINQKHLYDNLDTLIDWQNNDLIHGIGISLADSSDARLIPAIKQLKNVVMHVIDGCFTAIDLDRLADNNINLLILGYKIKGRGVEYYNKHKDEIETNIKYLSEHLLEYKNRYNGFAFDNLSTEHLDLKSKVSKDVWDAHYMGEEGAYTFFVSLVDNTYAISSMETENVFPIRENDTLDTIFKHIRKVAGHDK